MRAVILVSVILIGILVSGCVVTEESLGEINQQIENVYSSFSTMKYEVTENVYENNALKQKIVFTEMIERPGKMKTAYEIITGDLLGYYYIPGTKTVFMPPFPLFICNENSEYMLRTPEIMIVNEYVNVTQGITYCGEKFIDDGLGRWKIPMEIADETKYDVKTSEVDYNGKKAIKAVVKVLISEEEKQKITAEGCTPKNEIGTVTYWFDPDNFFVIKEESHGYKVKYYGNEVWVCETNRIGEEECGFEVQITCDELTEIKIERVYEGFELNSDIPDSEFEAEPSDYPGVEFKVFTRDARPFFGDVTIIEAPPIDK